MQKRRSELFSALTYDLPDCFPVSAAIEMKMPQAGRYLDVPHVHNVLEVGYCHEGRGLFSIAGKILPFRAGDVVVIGPSEPHMAANCAGVSSVWSWIFVDPVRLLAPLVVATALPDIGRFCGPGFCNVLGAGRFPHIEAIVRLVIRELKEKQKDHEESVRGLVLSLLAQLHRMEGLMEKTQTAGVNRDMMSRLSPALRLIQQRCGGKLSVRELAQVCAMSPTYFGQVFRRVLGRSPYRYVQQYRLSMACAELEATKLTVHAVAEKHGFPTLSCFVRAFRKNYGVPPRRWARGVTGP